ncbi:glycosyltransferase [Zunongwangia sp. F363]|uniref:Glycosyltransferase n=1 Tax=Autumnicola tepida TaxID=3075595 RepID=A0ABU3C9S6_9FLAO|nr:glycosyltransferase [Zunongwangia sp. F363]MDT0643089.1 glycosyltransferase [Zunongwangia sp. F363]
MPTIAPYLIHHVQLNEQDIAHLPNPEPGNRYYFVFWWYSIPLGHLYIEEKGCEDFLEAILDMMASTLKAYGGKEQVEQIAAAANSREIQALLNLTEQILSPYITKNIPGEVDISVVICTRNRSESLKHCLESLNKQVCRPREIIVVDNAPTDDRTKLATEAFNTVTYCKEARPGLDIARNTGARLAKSSIVAYTDDDVSVDVLWCYRVWESFLQENTDAMTGLVIASSLETESQQIFEKNWGFNKGYEDIHFNSDFIYKSSGAPKVWQIGAGANMAFKKKALEVVGYFDIRLDVGAAGCSGDSEIWFRMLAKNMNIHYNPRAIVYHAHRKELKELHKQLFNYMRGHSASVLIQHDQNKEIGYKKYLYLELMRYYLFLLRNGFPKYSFRYRTLWSEFKGINSGIRFYRKNRKRPSIVP